MQMRKLNSFKFWFLLKGQELDASVYYILSFLFLWLPRIFHFSSMEAVETDEILF